FDFEGHGQNPVPMSGDVNALEGTTARLVAQTREVISASRALTHSSKLALVGHSMATDILIRAGKEEGSDGNPVDTIVALSMYSDAVTAHTPENMLIISGSWERFLRRAALDAIRLIKPTAIEGEKVVLEQIMRRAVVAPNVEHVGILFSSNAIDEARLWLDDVFDRTSEIGKNYSFVWIITLFAGIVIGLRPLAKLIPKTKSYSVIPLRRRWLGILLPAIFTPFIVTSLNLSFMPVLVADYLMVHLALYGALQITLLGVWPLVFTRPNLLAVCLILLWGVVFLGFAVDRYTASFFPTFQRFYIILALSVGTILVMLADAYVTDAGQGSIWARVFARIALISSLGAAAMIDPYDLTFIIIALPVFVLFFLIHGSMGRWVGRQAGANSAGIGLGICLAWALGVSFPLFTFG
ncbi:MAG: alpha/beta hydrolase, partial [Aestuariivita sp.]|nr:alpha/beta hydrolase [Aestuariivita sp.]